MLKKAGIIVAGSAAALLAVSPLAFAGESGHWGHHPKGHGAPDQVNYVGDSGSHSNGLVAVGDVNALNDVNVCPSFGTGIAIGDLLGALGRASAPAAGGDTTCVNDNSIHQRNQK